MAKESPKELFDEMVVKAVTAVKGVIEREDLDEHLTSQDITKIAQAIEVGVNHYVEYIKTCKKQALE